MLRPPDTGRRLLCAALRTTIILLQQTQEGPPRPPHPVFHSGQAEASGKLQAELKGSSPSPLYSPRIGYTMPLTASLYGGSMLWPRRG